MTKKEYVQKYGGKFSISGGETWTMPNGHVVHFALNPKMGCKNTISRSVSMSPAKSSHRISILFRKKF